MRNKYSSDFEKCMVNIAKNHTLDGLLYVARKKYKYKITKEQLRQYLSKRKIKYLDYNNKMAHANNSLPIGSERIKSDGMTQIKISNDKWEYKQRYIYEKYYNVELTDDQFVIFLDQNKNNFDINNLKVISRQESASMVNGQLFSKNPKATETGIMSIKLKNKIKKVHDLKSA